MALELQVPDELRAEFGGRLLGPADDGYDDARRVHNGDVDKRPALIARCLDTADVVDAVALARERGLEVSVRGGGHNVAGKAVTEGGVMVDLALARGVHVDPRAGTARAQGGVTWRGYNRATAVHGLATTGGVVSTTGIAGLTLGGGLGWLMGRHGLAIDNLVSAEVVTASGQVVTASEEREPDLFWALRGGGGNFGVVTWFEFRAHPLTTVLGGVLAHPLAAATGAFDVYRQVTKGAPDDLTAFAALTHAPDGSGAKLVAHLVCHAGEPAQAEDDVRPLRGFGPPLLDAVARMPYPVVNTLLDGGFPRGAGNYWKSAFFTDLSDAAVQTMVDAFAATPTSMCAMAVEHFHGAVTRVAPDATAFPHREPGYNLALVGQWSEPGDADATRRWVRETFAALQPFMADRRYVNYLAADDPADAVRSAYGANYGRLVEVKRRWDPDNLFRLNQNIDPTG